MTARTLNALTFHLALAGAALAVAPGIRAATPDTAPLAASTPFPADGCSLPAGPQAAALQSLCTFRNGYARVQINGRWGWVDGEGRLALEPQFDGLLDLNEELAAARKGTRWGFIDKTGRWVIEPRFEAADTFSFGRARVTLDGKVGYIDKTGQLTVPAVYAEGLPFIAGVALVRTPDGTQLLVGEDGAELKRFTAEQKVLPPNDFGLYVVEQGGRRGLMRADGQWAIEPTTEPLPGANGRPYVVIGDGEQRRAIDLRGRVSTPAQPIGLMEDWPNWWWPRVENAGTPEQATVYSGFDFKDRVRIPGKVLPGQTFMDGVLIVEPMKAVPSKPYALYNHAGKRLGLYPFDEIQPMKEGFAIVGRKQGGGKGATPTWRYGALDMDGRLIAPVRFEALSHFSEERASARWGGQWGLVDIQGKALMHSGFTCGGEPVLLNGKKQVMWPAAARGAKLCAPK
jgi:hypothetical protein